MEKEDYMECCENCPHHKWIVDNYSHAMLCNKADKEHEAENILENDDLVPAWCPMGYSKVSQRMN